MKLTREEFDKLALEHLDMLYRVARRLCGDPTQAEDLVQETYLRAYRARSEFNLEQYGIRPWLVRIMHNLHVSRSMREKRQPVSVDDSRLDIAQTGDGAAPLNPSSFEGMDQRLVRAIEALPQEYQTVLILWAVDQFSYKEIAHSLDVPIGTVMSRLHRARTKLSETLADYARKEGIIRE
jgi:RNA polymerase sigma-70 factor (ECF subfamily)